MNGGGRGLQILRSRADSRIMTFFGNTHRRRGVVAPLPERRRSDDGHRTRPVARSTPRRHS